MDSNPHEIYIKNFNINLLECKYLGKGNNGIVYLLPDRKVIKICYAVDSCKKEYNILHRIKHSRYFPRVYGMTGNYMIRDYVEGEILKNYIKHNGLSRELSLKIMDLLDEFKKLKFAKNDIRCKDIIVKPDGELMIIDPKKFYSKKRDYPRHLCKGLYKLNVLDIFLNTLKEKKPKEYNKWNHKIISYITLKENQGDL